MRRVILACVAVMAFATTTVSGHATPPAVLHQAEVDARVPEPPQPVPGSDGHVHLAYEIHLTNFYTSTGPLRLTRVEVLADGDSKPLFSTSGAAVAGLLAHPPEDDSARDGLVIEGGRRAVLFLWVDAPADRLVHTLRHRMQFVMKDGGVQALDGVLTPVAAGAPIRIGPPLRGRWLANEGPGNHLSHHWGGLTAINGRATIPQRFAIDWFGLDGEGHSVYAAPDALAKTTDADWTGFGADVLAVADGVVRDARDGVPDGTPLHEPETPDDLTARSLYGNFVVLEIAPGVFAHYAHLRTGSVRVKVGQHVARGTVIGAVGQTGAAGAPHLHFHLSDAPTFEESEGLPYVIDRFATVGSSTVEATLDGAKPIALGPAKAHRDQSPLDGDIVEFPRP